MPNPLTFEQVLTISGSEVNTSLSKILEYYNNSGLTPEQYIESVTKGGNFSPVYDKEGVLKGWDFKGQLQKTTPNPINSNATTINRGNVKIPVTTTVETGTNVVKSGRILPPSGLPSTYSYVMNSIAAPIAAVATGITVGKTFDSALYNTNPDFFDSIGMGSFNPELWNNITQGVDYTDPVTGVSASLLNMILGLNPETGEGQAYIDENAFAYMSAWMQSLGLFSAGDVEVTTNPEGLDIADIVLPVQLGYGTLLINKWPNYGYQKFEADRRVYAFLGRTIGGNGLQVLVACEEPFHYNYNSNASTPDPFSSLPNLSGSLTVNDKTFYGASVYTGGRWNDVPASEFGNWPVNDSKAITTGPNTTNLRYLMLYGNEHHDSYEGISDQSGATLPENLTTNPADNLPLLQQQYPDLWNNAIDYPVVQDDGTVVNHKYIPVTMPNMGTSPYTQPVSGGNTQSNTTIDPATDTAFADLIAKLFQQPETDPLNPDYKPPENPTDTGEGSTPAPLAPTGSASALWAIYHPTQAQIDSFGAWLWSSDFIDQILKIFNNPMESIIGLHKVYATPIDAGTTTIQVGYLDSEVPSAYITQQYVNIDCGFVDLSEQFGNVFDYSPFTTCKLYLPFIGIVNLDVSEVMRSTVSVSYGVDVLTGACLARVNIERDGNSNVLYQFAGNCAVQYPLSMGSYMGIVSSIIGVAGSIAATVASGGSVAPLAIGAAGAALGAHTSVQNSGSFSGNAGAMGGKIPYLIIERPQTRVIGEQFQFTGIPTNEYQALGNFDGFVKCSDSHLLDVPATDEELTEISSLLSSGVIV